MVFPVPGEAGQVLFPPDACAVPRALERQSCSWLSCAQCLPGAPGILCSLESLAQVCLEAVTSSFRGTALGASTMALFSSHPGQESKGCGQEADLCVVLSGQAPPSTHHLVPGISLGLIHTCWKFPACPRGLIHICTPNAPNLMRKRGSKPSWCLASSRLPQTHPRGPQHPLPTGLSRGLAA